MYVLSVCTALQFPPPAADTALTLTSYSVPGASLSTIVVFWGGEPETSCWEPQKVVPCILYTRMYLEMASSLCGMLQVACKAGNLDDTALDRDRPVTWEGTSKMDRRNYVKFHYHRGTIRTCSTVVHSNTKTQAAWHVCSIRETALKPLEKPDSTITLLGGGFPY